MVPLPTTSICRVELHFSHIYILQVALSELLRLSFLVFSAWRCVFPALASRCHWGIFTTMEVDTCTGIRTGNSSTSRCCPVTFSYLGSVSSSLVCATAVVLCALTWTVVEEISSEATVNHELLVEGESSLLTLCCSLNALTGLHLKICVVPSSVNI